MDSTKSTSSFGSSLLVPSVQELVKHHNTGGSIPSRYIRPELLDQHVVSQYDGPEVPIVDLEKLIDESSMDSELQKLHSACKDWGFFQLVNHGVSSTLVEKMKTQVEEFFNLPIEEKKKLWQYPGEVEGFGQSFVVSDEQKLDWGDMFFLLTHPLHLRKPHLLPNIPLPFRDTLESYSQEIKQLAAKVLDQMSKALNMEPEEMRDMFSGNIRQTMRMNYYPPCPEPDKVIGLTPHSDGTGLTILLQVNPVEGLQIKKDGKWVAVKVIPDAFVVNVGDIMEIITNGEYRSIEHRATVNSDKERLSIACFHSPRFDGEIGPAASLVSGSEKPALFKKVTVREFFKGLFSRELKGKEIVKEGLNMVPSRYVRPDQIQTVAVDGGDVVPKIPVIDLKRLVDPESMDSELSKLHLACKEWGFFQLVNHGISSSLVEKMKSQVVEFFNLPMEEKKKLWQCPGDVEGFGQTFVVSEEQKLDWSDMFYLVTHPTHLRKPRDTMESYSLEIKNLAATLLKQIGKALKIENDEEIKDLIDNMRQTMRMNYYPPCPQPDKVMGLPPHSDGSGLTILLQVSEIDGLQIKKDGNWVPVKALPNAFVVNIGDILEIITNGAYRSIEHRAMVSRDKARLSIGLFHSPRYDGETGPASSLITEETPALYKRITIREFYNGLFSRQLDGKTYIDTLKINHEQNH
ncbi:Protein SRG1 [Linum perenne]